TRRTFPRSAGTPRGCGSSSWRSRINWCPSPGWQSARSGRSPTLPRRKQKEDRMRDRAALRMVPILALAAACGHPEQKVVSQYFGAVNSKDEQTLSSFAVVGFDQKVDSWTITEVRPETRQPAPLPE